jgi:hypothetical protein
MMLDGQSEEDEVQKPLQPHPIDAVSSVLSHTWRRHFSVQEK